MSRISLRDRVKNSIQDDILSGRLKPGDKLDEQMIASLNKASRTPVREAINQLAMSGLIELHENRGAFVSRRAPVTRHSESPIASCRRSKSCPTRAWSLQLARTLMGTRNTTAPFTKRYMRRPTIPTFRR
jgi:DNA-binding transcriptional regulator YhcF (GntR family)